VYVSCFTERDIMFQIVCVLVLIACNSRTAIYLRRSISILGFWRRLCSNNIDCRLEVIRGHTFDRNWYLVTLYRQLNFRSSLPHFRDITVFVLWLPLFHSPRLFQQIFGVFHLDFVVGMMLRSANSEDPGLISREIIFEVFQPTWPQYLNVTVTRTDGETTCRGNIALCVASCGNKIVQ